MWTTTVIRRHVHFLDHFRARCVSFTPNVIRNGRLMDKRDRRHWISLTTRRNVTIGYLNCPSCKYKSNARRPTDRVDYWRDGFRILCNLRTSITFKFYRLRHILGYWRKHFLLRKYSRGVLSTYSKRIFYDADKESNECVCTCVRERKVERPIRSFRTTRVAYARGLKTTRCSMNRSMAIVRGIKILRARRDARYIIITIVAYEIKWSRITPVVPWSITQLRRRRRRRQYYDAWMQIGRPNPNCRRADAAHTTRVRSATRQ